MASLSTTVALSANPHHGQRQGPISPSSSSPSSSSSSSSSPSPSSSMTPFLRFPSFPASSRRSLLLLCSASKRSSPSRRARRERNLIEQQRLETDREREGNTGSGGDDDDEEEEEEYVRPVLPGDEPDFWEGPQWNALGFIVQYLWAIGIVVALIGCFVAVRYYNEGASDFKETEVYKEAMEAQGFVETPSDSAIFDEPEAAKEAPSPSQ